MSRFTDALYAMRTLGLASEGYSTDEHLEAYSDALEAVLDLLPVIHKDGVGAGDALLQALGAASAEGVGEYDDRGE